MRARLVECGSTASDNGFCATVGRTTGLSHSTQLRTEFGRASRVSSRFLNLHILPSQGPRYPPNTLSLHISRARKRIPRLDPSTLMRTLVCLHTMWRVIEVVQTLYVMIKYCRVGYMEIPFAGVHVPGTRACVRGGKGIQFPARAVKLVNYKSSRAAPHHDPISLENLI